jgi:hypothetical protein
MPGSQSPEGQMGTPLPPAGTSRNSGMSGGMNGDGYSGMRGSDGISDGGAY